MIFLKTILLLLSVFVSTSQAGLLRKRYKPKCQDVECDENLECGPYEQVFQPRRACCPRCRSIRPKKCRNVQCLAAPECTENQDIVYTRKDCCGKCVDKPSPSQPQKEETPKEDPTDDECYNVDCPVPTGCLPEQQVFTPENKCCLTCPTSTTDCSAVSCPIPKCQADDILFTPKDKCCPECLDCSTVDCDDVPQDCPSDEWYRPEGSCCYTCSTPIKDECKAVKCVEPKCDMNFQFTKDGDCCPQCKCEEFEQYDWLTGECMVISCEAGLGACPAQTQCIPETIYCIRSPCPQFRCEPIDCSAVSCIKPECPEGVEIFTPEGQCCPKCGMDCSTVRCAQPPDYCPDGSKPTVPEGGCCATCTPDCENAVCIALALCQDGSEPQVPPGECCATQCPPPPVDCTAVLCAKPPMLCDNAQPPRKLEGECCESCPAPPGGDCTNVGCPEIAISCPGGVEPEVAPGQCCPFYCPDPCGNINCALPICPGNEEPKVPEGKCGCPQCPPV